MFADFFMVFYHIGFCTLFVYYSKTMKKVQRPWSEISAELAEYFEQHPVDTNYLKDKAKIDYHAARRILKGQVKNRTESAIRVCNSLGISLETPRKLQGESGQALIQAIDQVWDGTNAHAQLLIELIKSTSSFKIGLDEPPGGMV